jgi:hypothetical protein
MPNLNTNKEVFNSVANLDVVSSGAPSGDVGIGKSSEEEGFFIKSEVTFTLWFKDGSGVWNLFNNNASSGTYEWGANQSFFIQSDSDSDFYIFRRMETPTAKIVVKRDDLSDRPRTFDPPLSHTRVSSTWSASGHTGEAYSISLFGLDGSGAYLSAPASGQREGKILGWDENGDLGWIDAPASGGSSGPFIEELPFLATPVGSNVNFTELDSETALPAGNANNVILNPHVLIPGSEFESITDSWTISFWHYQTAQYGISANLFWSNYNFASGGNTGIVLEYYHNQFKLKTGGINHPFVTTFTNAHGDNLDSWAHVVITLDYVNSKAKFYKNGVLQHDNNVSINSSFSPDWTKNLFLGNPRSMSIDSFQLADGVLSDAEVTALYNAGRGTDFTTI